VTHGLSSLQKEDEGREKELPQEEKMDLSFLWSHAHGKPEKEEI
jgi:hypothetical protein